MKCTKVADAFFSCRKSSCKFEEELKPYWNSRIKLEQNLYAMVIHKVIISLKTSYTHVLSLVVTAVVTMHLQALFLITLWSRIKRKADTGISLILYRTLETGTLMRNFFHLPEGYPVITLPCK